MEYLQDIGAAAEAGHRAAAVLGHARACGRGNHARSGAYVDRADAVAAGAHNVQRVQPDVYGHGARAQCARNAGHLLCRLALAIQQGVHTSGVARRHCSARALFTLTAAGSPSSSAEP